MKTKQLLRDTAAVGAATLAMLLCSTSAQAQVFTETFGNAAGRVSNTYVPTSSFTFSGVGGVVDGFYTVMPPQGIIASTGQAYWVDLPSDHTGDSNGALMVLNAGANPDDIYVRNFNVQPGTSYRVSAWRYVVNGNGGGGASAPISWSLQIRNQSTNVPVVQSGALASTSTRNWIQSTYEFTVPADCNTVGGNVPARLSITNQSAVVNGNDLYVDDISVEVVPVAAGQAEFCPTGRGTTSVPTLDIAGLGLLSLLGAGAGALALRRRKRGH